MRFRAVALSGLALAAVACSETPSESAISGEAEVSEAADLDTRFAAFCETDTMFNGSKPCRDPHEFSDAQKERIMTGMVEYEEGKQRVEASLDAAVEEARQSVQNSGN